MNTTKLIDKYLKGAAYFGCITFDTEEELANLDWRDERKPHPTMADLLPFQVEVDNDVITKNIDSLWKAADKYISEQFGEMERLEIIMFASQGYTKALETREWCYTVWEEYYTRKLAGDYNLDFSNMGVRPYPWLEILEETQQAPPLSAT